MGDLRSNHSDKFFNDRIEESGVYSPMSKEEREMQKISEEPILNISPSADEVQNEVSLLTQDLNFIKEMRQSASRALGIPANYLFDMVQETSTRVQDTNERLDQEINNRAISNIDIHNECVRNVDSLTPKLDEIINRIKKLENRVSDLEFNPAAPTLLEYYSLEVKVNVLTDVLTKITENLPGEFLGTFNLKENLKFKGN